MCHNISVNVFSLRTSVSLKATTVILGVVFFASPLTPLIVNAQEEVPPSSEATIQLSQSTQDAQSAQNVDGIEHDAGMSLEENPELTQDIGGVDGEDGPVALMSGGSDPPPTISNTNAFSFQNSQPKVDGATGALTQRIALAIPPGRKGIQPELALEYNSQRTESGIVGYGWSISIPYIERLNKYGSQDLYIKPYYSSSIEGELATTSIATTSPYRAKIDTGAYNSYSLANDIWTVYDKKGTKYTYGSDSESRIQSTTSPSLIYRWMLREIRDTNGNYVTYTYVKDNNQIYPYKIYYTGNGVTDGSMSITFSTSTRSDVLISYKEGFNVTTRFRVTQIEAAVSSSWTHRYALSYTTGNNGSRSLLSAIQQMGQDESSNQLSLPSMTFSYASSSSQFVGPSTSDMSVSDQARVVGDVHGNGRNDISLFWRNNIPAITGSVSPDQANTVTVTPADYWANDSQQPYERGVRLVDVNADGKADIAAGTSSTALYLNAYATSTGYSWVATTSYQGQIPTFYDTVNSYTQGFFGDVNGDGLPDFQSAISGGTKNAALGNGSAWDSPSTTIFAAAKYIPGPGNPYEINNSQLVDVNGDGLDDWVWSGTTETYAQLNTGRGWDTNVDPRWTIATSTFYSSGSSKWDRGMRFVDMNGDGLIDFVRSYYAPIHSPGPGVDAGETGTFNYVMLNTGSGWTSPAPTTFPGTITTMQVQGCSPCQFYGLFSYNEFANWSGNGQHPQDVLQTISNIYGGTTTISYVRTAQSGLNPELPVSLLVASSTAIDDGFGTIATTTYTYSGGKMYLPTDRRERKFAGFWQTVESKPSSVVTTYFNQGDTSATTSGEQSDDFGQINRPFKEEVADLSGNVLQRAFYRWDSAARGNSWFVALGQKLTQLFNGGATHRDMGEVYVYAATTTGDLLAFEEYGEVQGYTNGTFDNLGDDERATLYTYAASSSANMSVPIRKQIVKLDFTSSTSTAPTGSVEALVVGGGGGGGGNTGGGGGAGGFLSGAVTVTVSAHGVTIGAGGIGVSNNHGTRGATSTFATLSAVGGGGGRGNENPGESGGSGGGAGAHNTTNSGGSGTAGQGNNGGASNGSSGYTGGGGGGGASAVGANGTRSSGNLVGGNGGAGTASSISGSSVTYAGGGGGGELGSGSAGTGGAGGGGAGGGNNATANTGGGGGGQSENSATKGGDGGSGIVIISYPTGSLTATGGSVTTSGTSTIHTFNSSGTFTVSSIGSVTATSSVYEPVFAEEKYSYDNLSYGSVNVGNPTKVEKWISGTTYASTTKTYNTYGLATQDIDPRGNVTNYVYDTLNLYVATSTNPLSQTVGFLYDYSSGKVKNKTDENNRVFQTVFDALDRPTQEKQPDQSTPTTLVTKTQYTYTNTPNAFAVQRTSNLNAATSTNSYEYFDGLGRTLQSRASTETSNVFATKDVAYDASGNAYRESLPYFSSGTTRTAPSVTAALYATSLRDALGRVTAIGNAVGTTTHSYFDWTVKTTDPLSNSKDIYKDAFGNIAHVVERDGTTTATTSYSWDLVGNLATTTDALGNVRGFVYDGLNRRTQAQDLHAPADTTYGLWQFTYDLAGNVSQQVDPKNQTVNFVYDALNRVTSEDYTGAAGTEITYTYDSCTDGKTRLCIAATAAATSSYAYNPLGLTQSVTTAVSNTDYAMQYAYDRVGNVTDLTYPNNTLVSYLYNLGGLVSDVRVKAPSDEQWSTVASTTGYSPLGQVGTTTFKNGVRTINSYNAAQLYRLSSKISSETGTSSPSLQRIDYTYDAGGNITQIVDSATTGSGHTSVYAYDGLNRLLSAGMISASSSPYSQYFQYDVLGSLTTVGTTSIGGNTGSLDYEVNSAQYTYHDDASAFDITGSMTIEAWIKPETLVSAMGIVSKTRESGSDPSAYAFYIATPSTWGFTSNLQGFEVPLTSGLATSTWAHIATVYDATTNKAEFFLNGLSVGTTSVFSSDPQNDSFRIRIGTYGSDGSVGSAGYDGLMDDLRIWNTARTQAEIMANKDSQLTGAESGLAAYYKFDQSYADSTANANDLTAVNNPVFSTVTPGGTFSTTTTHVYAGTGYANPHAPTTVFGVTHSYDNNGNLATSSPWNYYWDYRNRLTQVATGTATSTYSYDYTNQRVSQVAGGITTIYSHKFWSVAGATSTANIFIGDSLVATIEMDGRATTTRYIHTDHLGSTNVVTSASGTPIQVLDYLPYGGIRFASSTSQGTEKHQFIGQYTDTTGLNYLNARYYEGERGQFLSHDSVFLKQPDRFLYDPQQINSYNYARGNPIIYKDPSGECVDGISTIACVGAWALLSTIVAGQGLMLYGALTDNPEMIEAGIVTSNVGLAGGSGVAQARGGMNPLTGQTVPRVTGERMQSNVPGVSNLPSPSLVAARINSGEVSVSGVYSRPSGATNAAQRASVQPFACSNCGKVSTPMVANHISPLVVQHYTKGSVDFAKVNLVSSVNSQCLSCSNSQGGSLSAWSKAVNSSIDWGKINTTK